MAKTRDWSADRYITPLWTSGVACRPRLSPPVAKIHAGRRRATLVGVICARRTKRWPKGSRPYESHEEVSLAACSSCAVVIDCGPTAATHERSTSGGASRCMDPPVDNLTERGRPQGFAGVIMGDLQEGHYEEHCTERLACGGGSDSSRGLRP